MGFPRQEYRGGSPFPSPGDLPNPGNKRGSPAFWANSLLPEPPTGTGIKHGSGEGPKGQWAHKLHEQEFLHLFIGLGLEGLHSVP